MRQQHMRRRPMRSHSASRKRNGIHVISPAGQRAYWLDLPLSLRILDRYAPARFQHSLLADIHNIAAEAGLQMVVAGGEFKPTTSG